MDNPPPERYSKGKFESYRDEKLHEFSLHGWANASSGDVQSPVGWFARISISIDELPEIVEAFEGHYSGEGFQELKPLLGHFLLGEDCEGSVSVTQFETEAELVRAYEELDAAYSAWEGQE